MSPSILISSPAAGVLLGLSRRAVARALPAQVAWESPPVPVGAAHAAEAYPSTVAQRASGYARTPTRMSISRACQVASTQRTLSLLVESLD